MFDLVIRWMNMIFFLIRTLIKTAGKYFRNNVSQYLEKKRYYTHGDEMFDLPTVLEIARRSGKIRIFEKLHFLHFVCNSLLNKVYIVKMLQLLC